MTELASHANTAVTLTSDLITLKSTSCTGPEEGTVVDARIFDDILANVALEPLCGEGETSDRSSSGEPCAPSVSTCVFPTGMPQAITQMIATFSSSASAGSALEGSSAKPAQALSRSLPQPSPPINEELDEDFRFESPVDLRFVSSRRPASNSLESSVRLTSGFSSRFGAAGKETDPVYAQGDAALPTTTSESGTGHEEAADQEADYAFARNSDVALRSKVDTMWGTLAVPTPEPTFALPIHVKALETYLPAMIFRTAVEFAAPIDEVGRVTAGTTQTVQPDAIRVKILTFDLHPAALGPLTVRMRMNGKQLEIAIGVHTEEVRAILTQTREAMIEALAGHGLSLETPDIWLATPPPAIEPKPAVQDQSAAENASGLLQDQEGHDHHDRRHASTRHGLPGEEQPRKARGGRFDTDKPMGIYL